MGIYLCQKSKVDILIFQALAWYDFLFRSQGGNVAIIRLYKSRASGINPEAVKILGILLTVGFPVSQVLIEHVLRVEFDQAAGPDAISKMQMLFNSVGEFSETESALDPVHGPIREVCYKRAWTDPEFPSAMHAFETLGLEGVRWVRISKRLQFGGLTGEEADRAVHDHLDFNGQVQTLLDTEWATLVPQGQAGGVDQFDISTYSTTELEALIKSRRMHLPRFQLSGLQEVFQKLARPARDGELEMIAAYWSDHCRHTTYDSLNLLFAIKQATVQMNHPLVISAFADNAGGMAFYGGHVICFKGETHISPVFGADPYGGEETKHGGVIRDVIFFAKGAYPIAGTTIVATADPKIPRNEVPTGAFHPQTVVRETIRATSDYCNPMGIPMAYARYLKDSRNWKGFSLGHSVGIIPGDKAAKGIPKPGDYVVLIGGPRGLDGIHGATASSSKMTHETSVLDATHVQIGAPIEERKFMEAVPILRDLGCIRASTDCGAAGLASACGEMGAESGIWVNLAFVALKSAGMKRWEIFLSESQESGVLAVPPNKLSEAENILQLYEVPYQVIGLFTSDLRCVVVYDPALDPRSVFSPVQNTPTTEVVVDLPYTVLTADCPLPFIEVHPRESKPKAFSVAAPTDSQGWIDLCKQVLGHYNVSDQSWTGHRFDQTVQGRTVIPYMGGLSERMPDDVYVSTPVRGKRWAMGLAVSTNQYYGDVDPAGQGQLMYAQAVTKLVSAGFPPAEMVSCVNVYTPSVLDSPGNAWALKQLVEEGYVFAAKRLGIPVITGKDSSSGTFVTKEGERIDAPLTIAVATLGRHKDAGKLVRKPFAQAGDNIVLFHPGLKEIELGGSILFDTFGQRGDKLPNLGLLALLKGLVSYNALARKGVIRSRSVVSEAGLLRSLFESCIGSGLGCSVQLRDPLPWLFGELHGSIVFTTDTNDWRELGKDASVIGEVIQSPEIEVSGPGCSFRALVSELSETWSRTFNEVVA